jgi:hypothetical protein
MHPSDFSPARVLLCAVRDYLDERWPLRDIAGHAKPPPGLRLEMHPAVWYVLMTDLSLWQYADGADRPGAIKAAEEKFGLPIVIDHRLPERAWRLVIVTEDVLLGGKLDPPPTAVP